MARSRGQLKYFTFGGGWHTASTEVAFPPNAVTNIVNMDIRHDGSVSRRAGLDALGAATDFSASQTTEVNTYVWENVGNTPNLIYTVVQVGSTVVFYDYSSSEPLIGSVDLSSYATTYVNIATYPMQFASGSGMLFVANPYMQPLYIDSDFNVTTITINTRDFDGVDDSLDIDERPTTLSDEHWYNLLNQGWPQDRIDAFFTSVGKYPSNADVHFLGNVANSSTGILEFKPSQITAQMFGNTPAPKGSFIFNDFYKNRGSVSDDITLPTYGTSARPSAVAFYNGRVFWAGVPGGSDLENWGARIYFSQQLTSLRRVNRYYQEQDPTAEDFNDLLDTDGGVLTIPDIGYVVALRPTSLGVLAFADNGIWEVRGEVDGAFTPTGYSVRRITNIGALSASSIVDVAGVYMYWSEDGIIALQEDRVSLGIQPVNITNATIDSKYKEITAYGKARAVGTYNSKDNTVIWVYNDVYHYDYTQFQGTYHDDGDFNYKNRALILDIAMEAFYRYSFDLDIDAEHVVAVASSRVLTNVTSDSLVTSEGVTVTANAENVTIPQESTSATTNAGVRFVLRNGANIRVAALSNENFTDLGNTTGALIECAYITGNSPTFDKTGNYVFTYAKEQRFSFAYAAPTAVLPVTDLVEFEDEEGGPEDISAGIDGVSEDLDGDGNYTDGASVVFGEYTLAESCLDCAPDDEFVINTYWEGAGGFYFPPSTFRYATPELAYRAAPTTIEQYTGGPLLTKQYWEYHSGSQNQINIRYEGDLGGSTAVLAYREPCTESDPDSYCPDTTPIICGEDWASDGEIEYLFTSTGFVASACDPDAADTTPKTYVEVDDGDNRGALVVNKWDGFMYVPISTTTGNPIDGAQVSYYDSSGNRVGTRQYNRTRVYADAYDQSELNWE